MDSLIVMDMPQNSNDFFWPCEQFKILWLQGLMSQIEVLTYCLREPVGPFDNGDESI